MTLTALAITPFEPRYLNAIDDLIFRNYQIHTHLDWHETSEWLAGHWMPIRLAWQDKKLIGLLAASNPLNHTSWFRLAAIEDHAPTRMVMDAMWMDLLPELAGMGVASVSVLITRDWIEQQAQAMGFRYDEDIITLQRSGEFLPTQRFNSVSLRVMTPADLERVTQIDHSAFVPPWQMAKDEIRQAFHVAAISTVARDENGIVGYQISTLYRDGAHLARLAVAPEAQGQGVGSALLTDVLRRFFRRGIYSMTVNTQISNLRSQRLYQHFGFRRNGYDLGVWSYHL
jgi:ribosomal-protein-alanine N-acetyltransferase